MAVVAERYGDAEAWERKQEIQRDGLPVRLTVVWWGQLLTVVCQPLQGFTHLVRNVEECIREYGAYHISLAQYPVATYDDYATLHHAWHGVAVRLPIDFVSGEGALNWVIVR